MTSFHTFRLPLRGGIVLIDAGTSAVGDITPLRYDSDTLKRTTAVDATAPEAGNPSEVFCGRDYPPEWSSGRS